ncbi:hypothetical protein GWK47_023035 [Chionoecetes opilio]|uniref:Uncharacterized protein n=1 Tax=Chionoecetes opilio TaxID=41210 RepID=A0A8J4XMS6_CHIOP|nr:hypothetical protein GWK47_023035 [Chionoecetes opilio]
MRTQDPERHPPRLARLCHLGLDSPVVTEDSMARLLRTVNIEKAPGSDGVSPFLLKYCTEELTRPLTRIFQQCLQTGAWPSLWKEARVTPVHKKKETTDPANYRLISLLEETANVIDTTNYQLGDITAWGRRWQVKFAAEKTQALVISRSRKDARLLEGKLKFGDDTLALKDSINILAVEVDSRLSFGRHLETVTRTASLRVTLLRRVSHPPDRRLRPHETNEAQVSRVMAVQSSHLDEQYPMSPVTAGQGLRVPWRRSERATRTTVSGDPLLEAPRTHTATGQRAFTWAMATLWNTFSAEVDVVALNTQRV